MYSSASAGLLWNVKWKARLHNTTHLGQIHTREVGAELTGIARAMAIQDMETCLVKQMRLAYTTTSQWEYGGVQPQIKIV